MKDGDCTLI